jgi:predicted Zn finger-like uncharacterized protein
MAGQDRKIEARCPACDARYRVPSSGVGHRARCSKCHTTFRVAVPDRRSHTPGQHRPPTEDDILAWLNEGVDEEFIAPRPRVFGEPPAESDPHVEAARPENPAEQEDAQPDSPLTTADDSTPDENEDTVKVVEREASRLRKTG